MGNVMSKINKAVLIYAAVNILFLLPIVCINELAFEPPHFFIVILYMIGVIFYYIYNLTYVHIAVHALLALYSTVKFIKNRQSKKFIVCIIIAAFGIIINIYWAANGHPYTVV